MGSKNVHTSLFTCGMDQRCSSTAESMHWSMKSGFDAVPAGMNADVAAKTMCDKSIRRTNNLAIIMLIKPQEPSSGHMIIVFN